MRRTIYWSAANAERLRRNKSAALRLIDDSLAAQRQLAGGLIPAIAETPIPVLDERFRGPDAPQMLASDSLAIAKAS
ncbi:hypothetical protein [Paracoccus ravus]|uniref:hypothetical protein n=1 Tax=Paracoccus ravus TaxID=2447760 RepID=UPI00106ED4C9|nr:hypothetical protein [Paracoccus ravus]